jgi:multidrug resistance efflux pump
MNVQETPESMASQNGHADELQAKGPDAASPDATRKPDPVRRFAWSVIAVISVLFIWYVAADRVAPWTDQARVAGWIVPITPKVSGKVKKVAVKPSDLRKSLRLLFI